MTSKVYPINKGMNQPVRFKGLQAQYIWYLGAIFVALLFLFAVSYFLGLNAFVGIAIIASAGTGLFLHLQRLSREEGEHGMMKRMARRQLPPVLKINSRGLFLAPPTYPTLKP